MAALLVVVHHWTAWGSSVDLGNIGIQLFFVLSGFLITGILLDQRTLLETGESNTWEILSIFYKRRALRIWPVMFFTLALVWLAGNRFERQDDMLYHMLFSSNILFFLRGEFCSSLAHFWTLAVEQQFYLVWPFVILFTRRSRLEFAIIAAIAIAPLFRLALFTEGFTQFAQFNVFPLGNTDSLGTGSLMAFWLRKPAEDLEIRWRWFRRAVWAAVVGLAVAFTMSLPANPSQTFYAIIFASMIVGAYRGFEGIAGRILEMPFLIGLGTISYGVYVYHVFAPRAVGMALRSLDAPQFLQIGIPLFGLSATLTLLVSVASWKLLEKPVLKLGRRPSLSSSTVGPFSN
jgi:peptidoglycan/LPS O-acetylase OafA/YrhL